MMATQEILVHPLVLMSAVDHYQRLQKGVNTRVIGILIGEETKGTIRILNSFAVPFEEDTQRKGDAIWFLDHLYAEEFAHMMKKINTKERFLGWYSTGTSICSSDVSIHDSMKRFAPNPIFGLIDVREKKDKKDAMESIPIKVYRSFQIPSSDLKFSKSFKLLRCSIESSEAEAVAVEHLIRDVKDSANLDHTGSIDSHLSGIGELKTHLQIIRDYLEDISVGKLNANQDILKICQEALYSLPDFSRPELQAAYQTNVFDTELMLYVGSMTQLVVSMHELINNKRAHYQKMRGQ